MAKPAGFQEPYFCTVGRICALGHYPALVRLLRSANYQDDYDQHRARYLRPVADQGASRMIMRSVGPGRVAVSNASHPIMSSIGLRDEEL